MKVNFQEHGELGLCQSLMFVFEFISVGKERVQGKVVYSNKANLRVLQCSNCFSENHLMHSPLCTGIKDWNVYCDEFQDKVELAKEVPSVFDVHDRVGRG